ncbi:hypothetical protein LVD17_02815 [Fulvivirga ulvae]|uniref:MbnP family protein n=1 Tax=Fulvivirga ulvae TaxID=2904245 RepID=UPI001F3C7DB4|nr:MbnP family protein [Fulvivirga ulvae]UII32763.1 hypothetical protein LVD17_02815 [Fulvivirga ulvae]
MKLYNLLVMTLMALVLLACNDDDSDDAQSFGTFQLEFDHRVGDKQMQLSEAGSADYVFSTGSGEAFNLTLFGYYVGKIKLEGPNGELYEDEISITAAEVKGYYHVLQNEASSKYITLENVPAGTYNKVTFIIGVEEDGVEEGAAGGVLDPAEGAWFWNWNAGYIGFAIEGAAENSAQEKVEGDGWVIHEKSFSLHVGGWKDVEPVTGESQKFVNNVKTVTLDFDSEIRVAENLEPNAHIIVDLLKVLDGADIDFSTTYSVHSPKAGQPLANVIPDVFILDHTHQ